MQRLPAELHLQIIDNLTNTHHNHWDSCAELLNLCLLNKQFYSLADPKLTKILNAIVASLDAKAPWRIFPHADRTSEEESLLLTTSLCSYLEHLFREPKSKRSWLVRMTGPSSQGSEAFSFPKLATDMRATRAYIKRSEQRDGIMQLHIEHPRYQEMSFTLGIDHEEFGCLCKPLGGFMGRLCRLLKLRALRGCSMCERQELWRFLWCVPLGIKQRGEGFHVMGRR